MSLSQRKYPSDSRPALVLGMMRLNVAAYEHLVDVSANLAQGGITISGVRDTARILALESLIQAPVFSVSWADMPTDPDYHIQAMFGEASVNMLKLALKGQKLGVIFGDYYRFPSDYYRSAYSSFIKTMINPLVAEGLIDEHSKIILPKLNPGLDQLPGGASMYDPLFKDPNISISYMTPAENSLYTATNDASVQQYLNSPNHIEICRPTYDQQHPFMVIQFVTICKSKRKCPYGKENVQPHGRHTRSSKLLH
jgi:hypothetical protein